MTLDRVVAMQIIEGGMDSPLFENFLYRTLTSLRQEDPFNKKQIVLYLDNATLHKHHTVLQTARRMNVDVVYCA